MYTLSKRRILFSSYITYIRNHMVSLCFCFGFPLQLCKEQEAIQLHPTTVLLKCTLMPCALSFLASRLTLSISGRNITDTFGENNYFGSQVHFDVFILGLVVSQVGTEWMTVCQMRRKTKLRHDFSMNRLFHSCVKSLASSANCLK